MQSPLKKIIVYDLETGGLYPELNQITEVAMVVIDMEDLSIVEEFSALIKPRVDFSTMELEAYAEAKKLIKHLAVAVEGHSGKVLVYKGQALNLRNYSILEEDLEDFYDYIESFEQKIFTYEELKPLLDGEFGEIIQLYVDVTYNPQALEVTKISFDSLVNEGEDYEDVVDQIKRLISSHTVGNNKPIIAGHNIRKFDNKFLFPLLGSEFPTVPKDLNQDVLYDTLDMARARFYELPNFTLGSVANALGHTLSEAHRALPDTIANAKVLITMLKSLRGEGAQESKYKRRKFNFNF